MTKNGNWLKIASLTAIGGLIIIVITILGFAGGEVDKRIDVRVLAHEAETELVHQQDISEIQQDIAVMQMQQERIAEDISEIKEMIRSQ